MSGKGYCGFEGRDMTEGGAGYAGKACRNNVPRAG